MSDKPSTHWVVMCLAAVLGPGGAWASSPSEPPALRPGMRAAVSPSSLSEPLISRAQPEGGAMRLSLNEAAFGELAATTGPVLLESIPLGPTRSATLEVERFSVTLPTTKFVVGGADGQDGPLKFDPDSVVLLRGRVQGELHSRVYLALSERVSQGLVESSRGRFGFSSRRTAPPWEVVVFPALEAGPTQQFCEVMEPDVPPPDGQVAGSSIHSLRQVELAIETDHEFYRIFDDEADAAAYVVALYGAVSDVFMREINTRVDLTFVRIWDQPNEPFEAGLGPFRNYWLVNMKGVHRDVAQMFSGRGDLPGGVAYLNALCGDFAYSFCGNAVGAFAGPHQSSVYNYDLLVSAHELGHNFGTNHTHTYGLDACHQITTPPQRGTLMSYCSQTVSGGNAVMDMSFHKVTQDAMKAHTYNAPCVVFDCNQNGVADNIDIAFASSPDANANGVPDECEDCNANGALDPADITSGFSEDVNGNGLPDECEPDCNGNGIPDTHDISTGSSVDLHANNVPDECETDCDSDGESDYNQIMADMTLDKNRNVMLDACEDCDNDGQTDAAELDAAWNVWAASGDQNVIRQYHAVTGVLMDTSSPNQAPQPYDLIVAPGRRVLVSSTTADKVAEFDDEGNFVQNLVAAGSGGLDSPAGMLLTPRGTLLVASTANHRVLEYNLGTGAFLGAFVTPASGGLAQPLALAFGPDGHLYVSSASNQIFKYNGQTGAPMGLFVSAPANGGLNSPRGMVFKPDGNLLVTSHTNNRILEFNGSTGAFVKVWSIVGVEFAGPSCIRIAPNGLVHVSASLTMESHLTKADIHEFSIDTGNWVRGYVQGLDAGLTAAVGFDYLPGDATDCNRNQLPDTCDIARGSSSDFNGNGVPDECDPPCPADIAPAPGGNGVVNVQDLLAVIASWGPCPPPCDPDLTGDGVVNVSDLLAVIGDWGPCS